MGIGNGWDKSLQIDNAGNASLPGSITAGGTTIAKGASANIIGTTKQATTVSNQLVLQKGAVFSGTAANAGLVTRGICGVSTPDSNGACSKDNLYINYDNDNTYRNNRQLILQAGSTGTHYGSNLYQYAAARGDAVKGWVENSATSARTKLLETFKTNSTTDTYGTSWNFLVQWINGDRLKFKVIDGGAFKDSYPIEVDHAYKLVDASTSKGASAAPLSVGSATQPVYFSDGKPVVANIASAYLPLSGGTMTGDITLNNSNVNITRTGISQSWYQGRNSAIIKTTSYSGYDSILSMKTTAGDWSLGVYNDNKLYFTYILDSNYNANANTTTAQMRFDPDGTIVASKFAGSGAGLTSLNANNISTGTLPIARLPNHASTATTYGIGDATKYGHVILYPAASCTSYTSDAGGACTPAAVKKAVELFCKENSQKTGDILLSSDPIPPDGYLRCDGREITAQNYPNLYKILSPDYLAWGSENTAKRFPDSSVAERDKNEYLEYVLSAEGYHIARLEDKYSNSYFYYTTDLLSDNWTQCTYRGYYFSYCNGYFIQTDYDSHGFYYGDTPASFTYKSIDNMSSSPPGPICYMNGLYMAYERVDNGSTYNVVLYYCSTINGTWLNKTIATTTSYTETVKMVNINNQTILFIGNKMLILSVSSNQPQLLKTIALTELTDIDGIKYFNNQYYLYGREKNKKYFIFRHSSLNFDQALTNYAPPYVDYYEGGYGSWAEDKSDLIYNSVDKNYIFATSAGLMYTQDVSKGWIPGYMYMPGIATGTSSWDNLQFVGLDFIDNKLLLRYNENDYYQYIYNFSTKHLPNINIHFFSREFPYVRGRSPGTVYAYIKY